MNVKNDSKDLKSTTNQPQSWGHLARDESRRFTRVCLSSDSADSQGPLSGGGALYPHSSLKNEG